MKNVVMSFCLMSNALHSYNGLWFNYTFCCSLIMIICIYLNFCVYFYNFQTFCSDSQVADSACSATAYLTGTKANIATIGVKPSVGFRDCKNMMNASHQVDSVLAWAQVTTKLHITHFTHNMLIIIIIIMLMPCHNQLVKNE